MKIVKLGDICEFKPKKYEAKDRLDADSLVTFAPMEQLTVGQKYFTSSEKKKLKEVYSGYVYFREGDLIYAKITPCFENGKMAIAKNLTNGIGFGSSEFVPIRCSDEILPEYLYYFLLNPNFINKGISRMTGASGHRRIPNEYTENLEINLPSPKEQRRIVALLDEAFEKIDKAIGNTEKNLQNAQELFKRQLNDTFMDVLEESSSTYLANIVKNEKYAIKRGPFGSSLRKSFFVDKGYKVYEQKNAIQDDCNIGHYYITEEKYRELQPFSVKPGDIIVSCSGTIGKTTIIPENAESGIINQALLKISIDPNKMPLEYFRYFFRWLVQTGEMANKTKGSAIKNITSVKELKETPIPVVDNVLGLEEITRKLDEFLEQTQQLQKLYQEKLNDLQALKQSLLREAFSTSEVE